MEIPTELQNFIAKEDINDLIEILKKIYNDTLKQKVSILNIYGGNLSGKSVLYSIMKKLAKSSGGYSWKYDLKRSANPYPRKLAFKNSLVYFQKGDIEKHTEYLSSVQRWMNQGVQCGRELYTNYTFIYFPGVSLILTKEKLDIKTEREKNDIKNIAPDTMYSWPTNIPNEHIGSPDDKKYPRYPKHIHLPNKFKYNSEYDDKIVEICVKYIKNL